MPVQRKMFLGASKQMFANASALRKNMTKAEITLWEYLRTKPFGIKFRRQHPIGSYVADFYCHALKLIIEVDGNVHLANDVKNNDIVRQENLESEGLVFLRFTNEADRNKSGLRY